MSAKLLIAGVGNIFFGDDGFGCELARRLAALDLGPEVRVVDFGIRGLHLAYELLRPYERLILLDALARGGTPGTLYVLEPEVSAPPLAANGHGMDLPSVFAALSALGGRLPRALLIGCEPATLDEGLGLSESVARALTPAMALVRRRIDRFYHPHLEEMTP